MKKKKQKFCIKCGKKISKDARFCGYCGTKTEKEIKDYHLKNLNKQSEKFNKEEGILDLAFQGKSLEKDQLKAFDREDDKRPYSSPETSKKDKVKNDFNVSNKNIERWAKKVKNAGSFSVALGWIIIVTIVLIYLLNLIWNLSEHLDYTFAGLSDVVLASAVGFIWIVLGNRIKNISDKNTKKYIKILFFLSILQVIFSMVSGSAPWLVILVLYYLVVALKSINGLIKIEAYKKSLFVPEYKIKKKHWIVFIIIVFVLIVISLIIDSFMFFL